MINKSSNKSPKITRLLKKFGKPSCQFETYSNKLYEFENEYFCAFHLPLESKQKKDINFDDLLINILDGNNRDFNYVKLSDVNFNFKKYSEQLKGCIMFRGVTLSKVVISKLSTNYLLFEHSIIEDSLYLDSLNYVDIDFDDTDVFYRLENHPFSDVHVFEPHGFEISDTHSINLTFNHSNIRTKFTIFDNCKLSNIKFINSVIGWDNIPEKNLASTSLIIGNASIRSISMRECQVYMKLIFKHPEKIENFFFEDSLIFQAPCFLGNKLSTGIKIFPSINDFDISFLQNYTDAKDNYFYKESMNFRNLYSLSSKYNLQEDEKTFFCLAQRCLEKTNKIDKTHKMVSKIYDLISNYGTSIKLPLIWIVFFTVFPSVVYYNDPNIQDALELSAISMIKPFGFELFQTNSYWLSKTLNVIQNIIAPPLWAFFILSFRWNFKKITLN